MKRRLFIGDSSQGDTLHTIQLYVNGKETSSHNNCNTADALRFLNDLKTARECLGNNDEKFRELEINSSVSYRDLSTKSIHHVNCKLLLGVEQIGDTRAYPSVAL